MLGVGEGTLNLTWGLPSSDDLKTKHTRDAYSASQISSENAFLVPHLALDQLPSYNEHTKRDATADELRVLRSIHASHALPFPFDNPYQSPSPGSVSFSPQPMPPPPPRLSA